MISTANRWSLILENLVQALKALPFPDGVVIDKIASAPGVDAIIGKAAIGVCLAPGDRWLPGPGGSYGEIGDHTDQPAEIGVQIVIRADDATSTTAALDQVEAIHDLARIALRVRNVDIGIYGAGAGLDTGGVFLDATGSALVQFKGREPGGAGPLTKVFSLKTTALPL
jgi:hypothetical protein